MWVSPNHPDPPRRPEPPGDNGERLATFDRGPGVEMRVCLSEYEGHPYISLRVWEVGRDGAWWPTRRGGSVRISEAAELAEVLAAVAGATPAGTPRARRDPGRGPSAPWGTEGAAARSGGEGERFDEFDDGTG